MMTPRSTSKATRFSTMPIAVMSASKLNVLANAEAQYTADPGGTGHLQGLEWIRIAKELIGSNGIELAYGLNRHALGKAREEFLDVPADHGPVVVDRNGNVRSSMTDQQAEEIAAACGLDFQVCTLGYFDINMMHPNDAVRIQCRNQALEVGKAVVKLRKQGQRTRGVAGFVGRDLSVGIQQNFGLFRTRFIPEFLRPLADMGVAFLAENCHMLGGDVHDDPVKNIATNVGFFITLKQLAIEAGLGDYFLWHYDYSHDGSQGSGENGTFQALEMAGFEDSVQTLHLKDLIHDRAAIAVHTMAGQRHDLGYVDEHGTFIRMITDDGVVTTDPKALGCRWAQYIGEHSHPSIGYWNLIEMLRGAQADWVRHQILARTRLKRKPEETWLIVEDELQRGVRDAAIDMKVAMLQQVVCALHGADLMGAAYAASPALADEFKFTLPGMQDPYMADIPGLRQKVEALDRGFLNLKPA